VFSTYQHPVQGDSFVFTHLVDIIHQTTFPQFSLLHIWHII